jgi:Fic family protein
VSSGPLLCDPAEKAGLEARNGVDQIGYIDYLVNRLQTVEIRESHVQEFHAIAIADIYPCGGKYRHAGMNVVIRGSGHTLPPAAQVPSLVSDLIAELNGSRENASALERAALALWRLNWIHPFAGGNGRTARALAYLVLCTDLRLVPPGIPQFPTVIYDNRAAYVNALKVADAGVAKTGKPELSAMSAIVDEAITVQMASAIAALARPRR